VLWHRLVPSAGVKIAVDEFRGALAGLVLAEAEVETMEQLAAFPTPGFALREVTDDVRYTGGHLVKHGRPEAAV
jgi:CYTH domain-containing protein